MARPKLLRRMTNPPHFKGFSPIGLPEESHLHPVVLNFEEYEAIRLSDFEFYDQFEASQTMGISRPTYTRIYESARRKVAEAFVLGKPIVFEGGKIYFDSEWYSCNSCGCLFNHLEKEQEIKNCTLCGSSDIEQFHDTTKQSTEEDKCICPSCGNEKVHQPGIPCRKEICVVCNSPMIRKGTPYRYRMRNKN